MHLCECRQCLQRFGLEAILSLVQAVGAASEEVKLKARRFHAKLMQDGYAPGPPATSKDLDLHSCYDHFVVQPLDNKLYPE